MRTFKVELHGKTPLSQGRNIPFGKLPRETPDQHEDRLWHLRTHCDRKDPEKTEPEARVFIPPMAIKNCLTEAASRLGILIPGGKRRTFSKVVKSSVIVQEKAYTDFTFGDMVKDTIFTSNGKAQKGGGTRVHKHFAVRDGRWVAEATIMVTDPVLTKEILQEHLEAAGTFVGLGRFRPENGGYYGCFEVKNLREVK